jgi:hypothetical protein
MIALADENFIRVPPQSFVLGAIAPPHDRTIARREPELPDGRVSNLSL